MECELPPSRQEYGLLLWDESRPNLDKFSTGFFYFGTGTNIFLVRNAGTDYADSSIFVMVEWKRRTTLCTKTINGFGMLFLNCCKIY